MSTTSTATPRHKESRNLSQPERLASVIGGGALAAWGIAHGIQKRSWTGAALATAGGIMAYRGATGHCPVYQTLGINNARASKGRSVSVPYELGIRVDRSVTINRARAEVYKFWRELENLPRFLDHLKSVEQVDTRDSRWVAKAPRGRSVEWRARIINEEENTLIAWRSLPGSDVDNAGSVQFKDAPGGRGTVVSVELQYNPPGGVLGSWFAWLFGEEPSQQVAEDLRRLKQLLETGEIATTDGQPSGRQETHAGQRPYERKGWRYDEVSESSAESFPASDAPSWTPESLPH